MDLQEVAKIKLMPGEVLIVRSYDRLSMEGQANIRAALKGVFPSNKVLILDGGLELSAVTPELLAKEAA